MYLPLLFLRRGGDLYAPSSTTRVKRRTPTRTRRSSETQQLNAYNNIKIRLAGSSIIGSDGFKLTMCEDNEATIKIVVKRRSQAMRHVAKTHRINLDFLFDTCEMEHVYLRYVRTHQQIADILTKHFSSSVTWDNLMLLLGLRPMTMGKSLCVLPFQGGHHENKKGCFNQGDP